MTDNRYSEQREPAEDAADQYPLKIEWSAGGGLREVAISPKDLAIRADAAMDSARETIIHVAERMRDIRAALGKDLSQAEVSFGLKLDAEAGAVIAKASVEASILVKLSWQTANQNLAPS
jgi:hypothetical protein